MAGVRRKHPSFWKTYWRPIFYTLTIGALSMEVLASFDANPDTVPWTEDITTRIPLEVTFAGIGALCLWLVVHFWRRYQRNEAAKRAERENRRKLVQFTPGVAELGGVRLSCGCLRRTDMGVLAFTDCGHETCPDHADDHREYCSRRLPVDR